MGLNTHVNEKIRSSLDKITSGVSDGIPGLAFIAVDKTGQTLAASATGVRNIETKEPMTLDTVFWMASCTKLITGIACMQLVESGKMLLDSSQQVYELCPEIANMKYLNEDGELVSKQGDITLRMLLSHTSGFGYPIFNERARDYTLANGSLELTNWDSVRLLPLVNQPGSRWEYGSGVEWAGVMVERSSGLTLGDYFQKHIFEPLDIRNISFFPGLEMKTQLAQLYQRTPEGGVVPIDHPAEAALRADSLEERTKIFQNGGAGILGTPVEYCKILATLLNGGLCSATGNRVLQHATVQKMFRNQIPQWPNFGRIHVPGALPQITNPIDDWYPQEGNPPQGFGLTAMLTLEPGATGRGANTAQWAGITNIHWWVDREKGVAGMIASHVLPFGDPKVFQQWQICEKAVYDGLQA